MDATASRPPDLRYSKLHFIPEFASICRVSLPKNVCTRPDMIPHLDAILNGRNKRIGDDTVKTRNIKITNVMNEYIAASPLARF